MTRLPSALRHLRAGLHRRAQDLNRDEPVVAKTLWEIVGVLDDVLIRLTRRR